ncbi:MAG: T9SS type A sorting domain-containing protein, partial [Candidatus Zixiibacteriota bacterium]
YYDIRGAGFDSYGSLQFGSTRINSSATGGQQKLPAIAMNANGSFVTAWEDDCDKNGYTDIVARGIRIYNLTVVSNGGGTVNSGALSGPSGSQIAISAQPDNGMRFSYWTGGAEDPSAASTYVFMDGNRTVTAWFVTVDVIPPEFTIDILPNPVLPFELDLYFYPSELLNGVPEVTIKSPADSVAQTVTQLSNRDAACYLTDYRVGQSGSYTIAVCGTDPSANRGCKNENFSASQIFVNSGVELESPTGAIRLSIPAGWARDNGLVVYKERAIGPSDLALLNISIDVTPILVVDLTATVANSNKPFLLTVDARALDFSVGNGRTVVLVPIGHMASRLIPTRMNVSTGEYVAEVSDLGPYVIGTADIDKLEVLPSAYRLEQNSPNPFNGWTKIPFSTGEQAHVTIDVFNVLGQKVATLADRNLPAGGYSISWDGRTDAGEECGSGTYFYRLTAGSHVETKKMLYLK